MMTWAKEIKENTILRWNGVYNFRPKIIFSLETSQYILKTADSYEELAESCRLRHSVFFQEQQSITESGVDVDRFDSHFDHLIIVHKDTKKIIGTYRLSSSEYSNLSYTEQEFNLDNIFKLKGPHIELGRACIHKDFRRGPAVISLLWRGIIEYMTISGGNILFGCSSIKINNAKDAALIYKYLMDEGSVMDNTMASPTPNFQFLDIDIWMEFYEKGLNQEEENQAKKLIPSLLKSYLNLGAKIGSMPAFDKDFNCVDFLTILKKEDMTNSLARRFQVVQ